jgi:hypothetical protein
VFSRGKWEGEFKEHLKKSAYRLYYGPSASGKSTAIASVLSGQKGVARLELREATDPVQRTRELAVALGLIEIKFSKVPNDLYYLLSN